MEYFALNSGTRIAAAGIGTFLLNPEDAEKAVVWALTHGCDLIDTANAYLNEKAVGRGIRASGRRREEIYLSTKLWPSVYATADQAIDDTLRRLGTEYIDLLFLHQPVGDYVSAYHAMERAVRAGKVKALGLSNFEGVNLPALKEVLAAAEIKPAFVQVEAHPYFPQTELRELLAPDGIRIMAWYPLGHGDKALLAEPVIVSLAQKYHRSPAQIVLRWHTQMGHTVIPGSKTPAHIQENLDLFDFALTEAEMAAMAKLASGKRYYTSTREQLENFLRWAPDFEAQR